MRIITIGDIGDKYQNAGEVRGRLEQEGYAILSASTLSEVRVLMNTGRPDAIVANDGPDFPGAGILKKMSYECAVAGIPIFVLSADGSQSRVNEATACGCLGFIVKPYNYLELSIRLRNNIVFHEHVTNLGAGL